MTSLADHWLWLIAAAVLAVAEMIVPGVFLIWIGAAALITGIATLILPLSVALQLLLFAIAAFGAIYVGRNYLARNPIGSTDPMLNDKIARLIGEIVTAVEPIDASHGRVKVGDGIWSARGVDAAIGDKLRVIGFERGALVVERA